MRSLFSFFIGKDRYMKKLVIIMLAFVLTGCMTTKNTEDNFVVGMEAAYQPFNWQAIKRGSTGVYLDGGAGIADGYDVVIAQKIAKKIHKKLVIKKISWEGLPSAVESGEIDAIIAGMTANAEREEGIDFTDPYYTSELVLVVKADSKYATSTSLSDFNGARIVSQVSTVTNDVIESWVSEFNVRHMTPLDTFATCALAVKNGSADAMTAELPVATAIVKGNNI